MSRVTERHGTKTKAVRYGGVNDKLKAVKARFPRHTRGCGCAKCRKRNERLKLFPQIGLNVN